MQERTGKQIAENGMLMLREGKIRNHKLKNSAPIHTGEQERKEYRLFRDFLPSKNCCKLMDLSGCDQY